MLLNMISAMMFTFCAGLNLARAVSGNSVNWIVFTLDLLCAVLYARLAYDERNEDHSDD